MPTGWDTAQPLWERGVVGRAPTPFQRAVHEVLVDLRRGQVVSYSWVAHEAGSPNGARAVGGYLRNHPDPPNWWRVVAANGSLVSPDAELQAALLRDEGHRVDGGRVRPLPEHPGRT